jgi:hypothetical protein
MVSAKPKSSASAASSQVSLAVSFAISFSALPDFAAWPREMRHRQGLHLASLLNDRA